MLTNDKCVVVRTTKSITISILANVTYNPFFLMVNSYKQLNLRLNDSFGHGLFKVDLIIIRSTYYFSKVKEIRNKLYQISEP